jgi:transposase
MPSAFSTDLKWRIVFLYCDGFSTKQIARMLYMSRYTVKKVLRIYKKWGCVIDPWLKKSGRRKIFNGNDMKASDLAFIFIIDNYKFSNKTNI